MDEEDNHGGITVGAMGIFNRNAHISKMQRDVEQKGSKSKYWKWHQDQLMSRAYTHYSKIERYNKMPNWLKWIMKNPNKK